MNDSTLLLMIAEEMRHFESIFLFPLSVQHDFYCARIFTRDEELDFAGHPLMGAASAIHDLFHSTRKSVLIKFQLSTREVSVRSTRSTDYYTTIIDQGAPQFIGEVPGEFVETLLPACNLSRDDLVDLPLEVISTGLPYLIVPLKTGLAKIKHNDIAPLLSTVKAKFVYFYQLCIQEGRTWDNDGRFEDIATGSAVGPLGAYLVKHGFAQPNEKFTINQGRFQQRPSKLTILVLGTAHVIERIEVQGDICMVGEGSITAFRGHVL
jgi:PhzF family phenazine biosynthesis protein